MMKKYGSSPLYGNAMLCVRADVCLRSNSSHACWRLSIKMSSPLWTFAEILFCIWSSKNSEWSLFLVSFSVIVRIDAASFIVAAILIFTLPGKLIVKSKSDLLIKNNVWKDIAKGTKDLFGKVPIRFALIMEFIAAIAGAQILVNTVGHIEGALHLTSVQYGWAMSAFGIGATIAAFSVSFINKYIKQSTFILIGAVATRDFGCQREPVGRLRWQSIQPDSATKDCHCLYSRPLVHFTGRCFRLDSFAPTTCRNINCPVDSGFCHSRNPPTFPRSGKLRRRQLRTHSRTGLRLRFGGSAIEHRPPGPQHLRFQSRHWANATVCPGRYRALVHPDVLKIVRLVGRVNLK